MERPKGAASLLSEWFTEEIIFRSTADEFVQAVRLIHADLALLLPTLYILRFFVVLALSAGIIRAHEKTTQKSY